MSFTGKPSATNHSNDWLKPAGANAIAIEQATKEAFIASIYVAVTVGITKDK